LVQFKPHLVFEWLVTELTLKRLPEITLQFLALIAETLGIDPFFKTRVMDHTHRACTLAGTDKLINRWLAILKIKVSLINQILAFLFST
jgi:hypothetical protein